MALPLPPLLSLMAGYRFWRGRDGLGLSDVKLLVAGASLSLATVQAAIAVASLSALRRASSQPSRSAGSVFSTARDACSRWCSPPIFP